MGVKIEGQYLGDTRVRLTHESGSQVMTCAPKDNRGDGSLFSPTDLAVASIGSCIITIMSFAAETEGIDFTGSSFAAEKVMQKSPRMIRKIILSFSLPGGLSDKQKKKLQQVIKTCPVTRSLSPEVEMEVEYVFGQSGA